MTHAFHIFKNLLPLLILMTPLILPFFSHLIPTPILKTTRYQLQPFPPFPQFKLPKTILSYYFIPLILSFPSFNIQQPTFIYLPII
ncbi:YybS family protein, partial [Priestia megaterium]|uniref:YybS family protein n=1 Tax=Priestia megaterium TaxID=1404 RepID=UPI0021BE7E6F